MAKLSAEGDAFCSGANLKGIQPSVLTDDYAQSALARLLRRLTTFGKPLVAAVHGLAIGGGTTLLLHCDFVYAAEGTRFQMPFTKLGLVPEFGSSYLFPLNAGMRLASELVLLGEQFDAETAQRAGLVTAVEPAEGFESGVGMDMVEPPVLLICRDRRPQGRNILADHSL